MFQRRSWFFAIKCDASASRTYLLVSRRMPEKVSAAVGMTVLLVLFRRYCAGTSSRVEWGEILLPALFSAGEEAPALAKDGAEDECGFFSGRRCARFYSIRFG